MVVIRCFILVLVASVPWSGFAQTKSKPQPPKLIEGTVRTTERVYKTTPQGKLNLHFFIPPEAKPSDKRPAIVFFFGGAWKHGSFTQFVPQAEYFASRGLVCACADYRISSVHQTTPDQCVEDAKSAMRWLRVHAVEFGIDPNRLVAAGGSAGGHLAAAAALVPGFDAAGHYSKVSCVPNALILFNPALNLTDIEMGIADAAGKDIREAISPTFYLHKDAPPAILFFGSADKMLPMGQEYLSKAHELGVRVELFTAADMPHGFFNKTPWTQATARQADLFLKSLGYLTGEPTIKMADPAAELKAVAP